VYLSMHRTRPCAGFFIGRDILGVKFRREERRSPKPDEAGSMPATPAIFLGSEGEVNSHASHKRRVDGLSPSAATSVSKYV
jgi:hypothetical protein